jgi:hypothetical protein
MRYWVLGVFLYIERQSDENDCCIDEGEGGFFWMSIWRLASKGGSPSLPHPPLLYTPAPDPFAGGRREPNCSVYLFFSGFISSPRHKKCPHFFFLKNVFTYCWMRQLLRFDSEFTRSAWLLPTWHSLAFLVLYLQRMASMNLVYKIHVSVLIWWQSYLPREIYKQYPHTYL